MINLPLKDFFSILNVFITIFVAVYHFKVYFDRRKIECYVDSSLYLTIFLLAMALNIAFKEELIMNYVFNYNISTSNFTFFTILVSLISLRYFVTTLTQNRSRVNFINIMLITAVIIVIVALIFINLAIYGEFFVAFGAIYIGVCYLTILIYYLKKQKSREMIYVLLAFLTGFLIEFPKQFDIYFQQSNYITFLCILGIAPTLFLAFALSTKFSNEFAELVRKSAELELKSGELKSSNDALQIEQKRYKELNDNLEQKVVEKTAELHQSNDELKVQRDEKAQMLLNIAHEIRNPLTVVSVSFTDFVKKWGEAEGSDELLAIKNGFDQMLRDVVNITDSELLKRGKLSYEHNKIIKLDDIEAKCELYRQAASAKGVNFSSEIEKGLFIKSDPNALSRIVNNLLGNALKYTNLDGEIIVELRRVNEAEAQFIVKDDGLGMDEEQLERVFDPDQNIYKEKSNRQGLGIGLSLVKYAVESLKGKIDIESRPKRGTTFTVTLPLYTPQDGEMIESFIDKEYLLNYREGIEEETGLPIDRKVDILHVEDKPELFNTFKRYFSGRYNFHNATNGCEALEMLKELEPTIIISDIMMEKMDGVEFRKELLKVDKFKATPFIFLSARNEQEEIKELLKDGAADFIKKPIADIAELEVKIRQYVRMSQLISEYEISRIELYQDGLIDKAADAYELTKKEFEVFSKLVDGKSNEDIAKMLGKSERTVENQNTSIYKKFGVKNRNELLLKIFVDNKGLN